MLVVLRDRGIPLPAGAILISPWVDLTHSFPSLGEGSAFDYIPAHGFLHRPSAAWPPPNADEIEQVRQEDRTVRKLSPKPQSQIVDESVIGFSVKYARDAQSSLETLSNPNAVNDVKSRPGNPKFEPDKNLSVLLDGKIVEIKDQIQMYTTNQLISHPLVSPILQPSLGGLPPLLVMTGGAELLRDEQIYLAHKAANPRKYLPGNVHLFRYPGASDIVAKWKPTNVQLQIWDDLCHVTPALSFTKPAKYMYRSIAQFGAWALAQAQKTEISISTNDDISIISSKASSSTSSLGGIRERQENPLSTTASFQGTTATAEQVGKAGQPIPPFKNHMIRQRVDRHGNIFPLDAPSSLPALQVPANDIGLIKPGPVRKWIDAQQRWSIKFAKEKKKVQNQRMMSMTKVDGLGDGEVPPPSALAGRIGRDDVNDEGCGKKKKGWGLSMWSVWGSSHDEKTVSLSRLSNCQHG